MSFRCEKCKRVIKPNMPQSKIVKERVVPMEEGRTRKEICSEKKVCFNCSIGKKNKKTTKIQS